MDHDCDLVGFEAEKCAGLSRKSWRNVTQPPNHWGRCNPNPRESIARIDRTLCSIYQLSHDSQGGNRKPATSLFWVNILWLVLPSFINNRHAIAAFEAVFNDPSSNYIHNVFLTAVKQRTPKIVAILRK